MGLLAHLLRNARRLPGITSGCVLLLLSACAGTETGNPPAATEVDVLPSEMWEGPPYFDTEVLADAGRLGMATMTFGRVEALPAGTCAALLSNPGAAVRAAVELELHADLGFDLPAGRYCGVRLFPQLTTTDNGPVPPLLVGHSLLFELRDLQGASYVLVRSQRVAPFVLLSDTADPGAFFDVPAEGLHVRLAVDAASALIALEFWETTPRDDGSFVFEETNAAAFLRAFEAYPGLLRLFRAGPRSSMVDGGIDAAPPFTEADELAQTP